MDAGKLEITTCGATHGFLPLMKTQPAAVRAQVEIGAASSSGTSAAAGHLAAGVRLPRGSTRSCARPASATSSSRRTASCTPSRGPATGLLAPLGCRQRRGRVRPRHRVVEAGLERLEGYPGDSIYRDFYRDVGFDLDYEYLRPFILDGIRSHPGIKYYKITGPPTTRSPTTRRRRASKAAEHAGNFMFNRREAGRVLRRRHDGPAAR